MKIKKCLLALCTSLLLVGCSNDPTSTGTSEGETSSDSQVVKNQTIYASPTGKVDNLGTRESPYDAYSAFNKLTQGSTLVLLEGTYSYSYGIKADKATEVTNNTLATSLDEMKTVEPDKDANGNYVKVTFDFSTMPYASTNRGITLDSDYWHIKDFEVVGAGDNGVYIGGNYNIVEHLDVNNCSDTGIQLGRADSSYSDISEWPSYNTILNCTSHDNHDPTGEDSDGFACKLTTGIGNVFDGCIAYNNVDDGWDLYTKGESGAIGPVTLKNCVAFNNGITRDGVGTSNSDGNGFKLGGETIAVSHTVENCVAFNNMATGFTDNSNPGTIKFISCTAFNNGTRDEDGYNFSTCRDAATSLNYYENCLSYCTGYVDNPITKENHIANSHDEYKGSGEYNLFYSGLTNFYIGSIQEINYSNEYKGVNHEIENPFVSITSPQIQSFKDEPVSSKADIHTLLRNEDGTVNLGDFLKVNPSSWVATAGKDGTQLGANLSK